MGLNCQSEKIIVKMPEIIEETMFAPCGMNCYVCYRHINRYKRAKPCKGCFKNERRVCKIKSCVQEKSFTRCLECGTFPCQMITDLEKNYMKHYQVSLIDNSYSESK
jgi:hypothetical protein